MSAALDIGPHDPVPLADAVRLFFPAGGVTVSALRTEARKGRLAIERIAGKDFVTKAAIDKMRGLCRVQAKGPDCGSGDERGASPNGSSSMERMKSAQDAARETAKALKTRSIGTKRPATRSTRVNVIRPAFRSPKS